MLVFNQEGDEDIRQKTVNNMQNDICGMVAQRIDTKKNILDFVNNYKKRPVIRHKILKMRSREDGIEAPVNSLKTMIFYKNDIIMDKRIEYWIRVDQKPGER